MTGLINDAARIEAALAEIPGVLRLTRGWPKSWEELPCLALSEAGNTHYAFRDDAPYVDELVYDVRIFAIKTEDKDAIAPLVEGAMVGLGYQRMLIYDEDQADVRQKVMRYKRYFS